MGLLDSMRGNASSVDAGQVQGELQPLLVENEQVWQAFAVFRDQFVFTSKRLVLVDKQGLSGKKVEYRSIPYGSISEFSVETAGTFDADSELVIRLRGGTEVRKEFGKKSDINHIAATLAHCMLA